MTSAVSRADAALERPLLAKERAMWLFHEYTPDDAVMNVTLALEAITRPIDVAALRAATEAVVARHPALRTLFPVVDGEPVRTTLPAAEADGAGVVEVREVAADELPAAVLRAANARFEITRQLPIRVTVLRAAAREVVSVTANHLVYDAYSARIVDRDLKRAYASLCNQGTVPADLMEEVAGPPLSDGSAESVAHWTSVLAGVAPSGDLDLGRHAPRVPGFPGATLRVPVCQDAWAAAESLAHELSCPVSAVALAAFATVLFRHGAGTDLVVGVPTYNRGRPAHDAVGYYMTIEPMRARFGPQTTFAELTRLCAEQMLEGLQYADASLDEVRPGAYEGSGADERPLVRYLFNYLIDVVQDPPGPDAGPRWRDYLLDAVHSRMDIDLAFVRDEDGVALRAVYAADLMTGEHAAVLLARIEQVLRAGAAASGTAVGALDVATDRDRELLARSVTGAQPDARDVLEDLAAAAFADPGAVAIAAGPDRPAWGQLRRVGGERRRDRRGAACRRRAARGAGPGGCRLARGHLCRGAGLLERRVRRTARRLAR